jgi:hypothetical protein
MVRTVINHPHCRAQAVLGEATAMEIARDLE